MIEKIKRSPVTTLFWVVCLVLIVFSFYGMEGVLAHIQTTVIGLLVVLVFFTMASKIPMKDQNIRDQRRKIKTEKERRTLLTVSWATLLFWIVHTAYTYLG